jgi:hypothetical protein
MSKVFAMLVAQLGGPPKADLASLAELSLAKPEELSVVGESRQMRLIKAHPGLGAGVQRASERSSSCSMLLIGEHATKSSVTAAFNWRRAN